MRLTGWVDGRMLRPGRYLLIDKCAIGSRDAGRSFTEWDRMKRSVREDPVAILGGHQLAGVPGIARRWARSSGAAGRPCTPGRRRSPAV
jgi:hypothetical protein